MIFDLEHVIDIIKQGNTQISLKAWCHFIDKHITWDSLADYILDSIDTEIKFYPKKAIKSLVNFANQYNSQYRISKYYANGAIKINKALRKDSKIKDYGVNKNRILVRKKN